MKHVRSFGNPWAAMAAIAAASHDLGIKKHPISPGCDGRKQNWNEPHTFVSHLSLPLPGSPWQHLSFTFPLICLRGGKAHRAAYNQQVPASSSFPCSPSHNTMAEHHRQTGKGILYRDHDYNKGVALIWWTGLYSGGVWIYTADSGMRGKSVWLPVMIISWNEN